MEYRLREYLTPPIWVGIGFIAAIGVDYAAFRGGFISHDAYRIVLRGVLLPLGVLIPTVMVRRNPHWRLDVIRDKRKRIAAERLVEESSAWVESGRKSSRERSESSQEPTSDWDASERELLKRSADSPPPPPPAPEADAVSPRDRSTRGW